MLDETCPAGRAFFWAQKEAKTWGDFDFPPYPLKTTGASAPGPMGTDLNIRALTEKTQTLGWINPHRVRR